MVWFHIKTQLLHLIAEEGGEVAENIVKIEINHLKHNAKVSFGNTYKKI